MNWDELRELAEFLAASTALATIDPSAAGAIASQLYAAGWRKTALDHRLAWMSRKSLRWQATCRCEGWLGTVQMSERDAVRQHAQHVMEVSQ